MTYEELLEHRNQLRLFDTAPALPSKPPALSRLRGNGLARDGAAAAAKRAQCYYIPFVCNCLAFDFKIGHDVIRNVGRINYLKQFQNVTLTK